MILITGATGFLGRNLCEHLAGAGYPLRALVRPGSDTAFLEQLDVELAPGDVTDPASLRAAMQGCRQVVHTAAYFRFWGPPEPFIDTNFMGTRNMLEAAAAAGIRKFVHISTIIVVGPQGRGKVITERTPYAPYPSDRYAKTKTEAEKLALYFFQEDGLPVVILRLGALYGPHGHYAFNRLFFEEYLHNWRVQVHGGRRIIFPCYVGDAASGIELALEKGQPGEIYNISGRSIAHRDANKIISRLAGRSSWRVNIPGPLMMAFVRLLEAASKITRREPFYPQNLAPYVFNDWIVDISTAEQKLGFAPISFEEGAQLTLDWYREIGYRV